MYYLSAKTKLKQALNHLVDHSNISSLKAFMQSMEAIELNGIEHDTGEHITLIVKKSIYGGVIVNHLCQQGDVE